MHAQTKLGGHGANNENHCDSRRATTNQAGLITVENVQTKVTGLEASNKSDI
jgi:hypothetical protein